MASARFVELERRLKKLRARFLPKVFSATGDYTDRQLDHARGYRLLAHAEIEAFLEDRAQQVAIGSLKRFRLDGRPRHVLMNLLAFNLVQDEVKLQKLKDVYATKTMYCGEAIGIVTTAFNRALAMNNGIREVNVLRVLLPLGLDPHLIDPAWLSTLDAFGLNRGEIAHKSMKTHQQIDPQDELNTTHILLRGLEDLDTALSRLH
jgi:hypothetical protein